MIKNNYKKKYTYFTFILNKKTLNKDNTKLTSLVLKISFFVIYDKKEIKFKYNKFYN